jgi:hypothetical protein
VSGRVLISDLYLLRNLVLEVWEYLVSMLKSALVAWVVWEDLSLPEFEPFILLFCSYLCSC